AGFAQKIPLAKVIAAFFGGDFRRIKDGDGWSHGGFNFFFEEGVMGAAQHYRIDVMALQDIRIFLDGVL
ncbi:hypothetical protein, partial [Streptococcus salivarius]|uniref:hypothetical protein n=1 Tax=Streptococcus salivarius TaxID=1304 RepID=UPI0022229B9E